MHWRHRETDNYGWIKYLDIRRRKTFQRIENSLPGLDIESILMEIRWKGVRQRATIRPDLHALTPQARLIDNPYVIVMSVKSAERPPSIAIN